MIKLVEYRVLIHQHISILAHLLDPTREENKEIKEERSQNKSVSVDIADCKEIRHRNEETLT